MRNLSAAIKSSMRYPCFDNAERQITILYICGRYAVTPHYDRDTQWIEFHSVKSHRLGLLMHRYYRLVFALREIVFTDEKFHVEYVDGFEIREWYIDDVDIFNHDFEHIDWYVRENVINPYKFDLVDLCIATG